MKKTGLNAIASTSCNIMKKIKKQNKQPFTLIIYDWMYSLGINGNNVQVYAMIYAFSGPGSKEFFRGGPTYIKNRLNIHENTAQNCLNALLDRKFIRRIELDGGDLGYAANFPAAAIERYNSDIDRYGKDKPKIAMPK